ncbi:MAG: hypothetical protein JST22_15375 [Bacteroidetes bacterium]|nr:hypothetical protein [Bacteroidota bacterium]
MITCVRTGIRSLLFLLLLVCGSSLHAQEKKHDSLELRYRFVPGQTLTYRVFGYDTIVIYDSTVHALSREREEMVTYRCDSIVPQGYVMTLRTTAYKATERRDTATPVVVTSHPWVGRSIRFLMSPTGRRLDLLASPNVPATGPGGPFAPMVLPNLGADSTYIGSSDQYVNEQWTVDALYPPIRWRGNCMRNVERRFDTLGNPVVEVSFSEVGNNAYRQPGKGDPTTSSLSNGGGSYYCSARYAYPIAGNYEMINNLTMDFPAPAARKLRGRHTTGILIQFISDSEHPGFKPEERPQRSSKHGGRSRKKH